MIHILQRLALQLPVDSELIIKETIDNKMSLSIKQEDDSCTTSTTVDKNINDDKLMETITDLILSFNRVNNI